MGEGEGEGAGEGKGEEMCHALTKPRSVPAARYTPAAAPASSPRPLMASTVGWPGQG